VAVGLFLIRNGRPDEATPRFAEAVQLDPDNAAAHVQLGEAAARAGKVDEAREHFATALRLVPEWPGLGERLAGLRKDRAP